MGLLGPFSDGVTVGPRGFVRPASHRHGSARTKTEKRHSQAHTTSRSGGTRQHHAATSAGGSILGSLGRSSSSYSKGNTSRSSLFGLRNWSRSSLFGGGTRSSYYKRSPRPGFMQRAYAHLKRLLRDLVRYAKRHPWKVFFLVLMPLLTGGALSALLARFGLRMPHTLERLLCIASRAVSGDSLGLMADAVRFAGDLGSGKPGLDRGSPADMHWERTSMYQSGFRDDPGWSESIKGVTKFFP